MYKNLFFTLLLFVSSVFAYSQETNLKEQALEAYGEEHYTEAIRLMKSYVKENPNDAEGYYYLGFFIHYNAYDSRPMAGYDASVSDTVFKYMKKALKNDPDYGNARYFYTAECGAAASRALRSGNYDRVIHFYEKAAENGGFPSWQTEIGKRMLKSCKDDAILFVHGDVVLNTLWYLQLCKDVRKDVSVIPLVFLNRPWYVKEVKSGDLFRNVKMNLSDGQIMGMHHYKWDTTTIHLNVPKRLKEKYELGPGYTMDWVVKPDLWSNRTELKIDVKNIRNKTYMSAQRAVLLNIIESNKWKRPVYFTNTFNKYYLADLDKYFQYQGVVSKLLPMKTEKTDWNINIEKLEQLVFKNDYKGFKSVLKKDQPRGSRILNMYYSIFMKLAEHYKEEGDYQRLNALIDAYKEKIMIGFKKEYEQKLLKHFEEMSL
jgi:hypothetical protein